jgi:hypothetical protein
LRIHAAAQIVGHGINNGVTPVHKTLLKTLGISAATAALAFFAYGASAQDKKPAPAKKPPACNSLKTEAACNARDDCTWVGEVVDAKTKKVKTKAYCRAKPKAPAAKKK